MPTLLPYDRELWKSKSSIGIEGEVKFAIWGPGEEIHGTATALALHKIGNDP